MPKIVGCFQLDKSNLLGPACTLVIGTRKHPTPSKPKNYLLLKEGGKFIYLSSLYPVPPHKGQETPQIFDLEVGGVQYQLSIDKGQKQAEIRLHSHKPSQAGGGTDSHKAGAKAMQGGGRFQNA
jgi:hypothetical protein